MLRLPLLIAAVAVLVCAAAAHAAPRCYGAAAMDPEHQPCENPALRLKVTPTPEDALITPSAPCTPVKSETAPPVCWFGAAQGPSFALIGDSHAVHWRAALTVVAKAKGWHGISLDHSQCAYTTAPTALPGRKGEDCAAWRTQVFDWLARHPEVTTVFVSQNSGGTVKVEPGQSVRETKIAGYINGWLELPDSIGRIYVLRDVPHVRRSTASCLERAVKARTPPGETCAMSRKAALGEDPAFTAATRVTWTPRIRPLDLSDFMCDAHKCYPVVGGVLVHRDLGHMTRAFSATLGPYLIRALDRVSSN